MIQPYKGETSKLDLFRAEVNKWMEKNKDRGCSPCGQFNKEVSKLKDVYRLLAERQYASIKKIYDVDYGGYLNLFCNNPCKKNPYDKHLSPFVIKIQDYFETCKDIIYQKQHIDAPVNTFGQNKKFGYISQNIFANNGKFSSDLDEKTKVICQKVTDMKGNLFTGKLRFFGDRIHSILEPHRLSEFPKLNTKYFKIISSSMISAELRDEKGNQLKTQNPIRIIEKVPDMIDNQTASTFKKFMFDPIDSVWVEKPGLIFNQGNRTFQYQLDTIQSLGPSYLDNMIDRLGDIFTPSPPASTSTSSANIKDISQGMSLSHPQIIKVYNTALKTFGYETFLPKCLRVNYVQQCLDKSNDQQFMFLYQQKMVCLQIEEKRFYFLPLQYQLKIISAYLDINQDDRNQWKRNILIYNEEVKTEAEKTGFISIDLKSLNFTRKENAQKIRIFSNCFKQISLQGSQINNRLQQDFLNNIEKRNIIKREISIFQPISLFQNLELADQTQAQKKLIQQITFQTVYIAERMYHTYLINFLLRSIDHEKKNKKIMSPFIKRKIINQAQAIAELEKKRLLGELEQMKPFCKQVQFDNYNLSKSLSELEDKHSQAFSFLYNKQFRQAVKQSLSGFINDKKIRMKEIEQLNKDVKQCIKFLQRMKNLRGGAGISFATLLKDLGQVCQQFLKEMNTKQCLDQRIMQASLLNLTVPSANSSTPFKYLAGLFHGRSVSLIQFFSRIKNGDFKTPDDILLNEPVPRKKVDLIQVVNIQTFNLASVKLIEDSIKEIVNLRVDKQEINRKLDKKFNDSGLAKKYSEWGYQSTKFNNFKNKVKQCVQSMMGSEKFGLKCQQFFVKQLQKQFSVAVNRDQKENMQHLKATIKKIKQEFIASQHFFPYSDHIENIFPQFNKISTILCKLNTIIINVDALTNYGNKWEQLPSPPSQTPYQSKFKVSLNGHTQQIQGLYFENDDYLIKNDKAKAFRQLIVILEGHISSLQSDIDKSRVQESRLVQSEIVKLEASKKIYLKGLVENRRQRHIYHGKTFTIPIMGALSQDQKQRIQSEFKSQILPKLEIGDIGQNCLKKIEQLIKGIEEDLSNPVKILVDKEFHQEKIKQLLGHKNVFQKWIKDATSLNQRYEKIVQKYKNIKMLRLKQIYQTKVFQKEVVNNNNKIIQQLRYQMKSYNQQTKTILQRTQIIDTHLFKIDFTNIKISASLIEIHQTSKRVQNDAIKLMALIVGRRDGQSDALLALQQSLTLLDGLELNDIEAQKKQFSKATRQLRGYIQQYMQQRQLSPTIIRKFEVSLQIIKDNLYKVRAFHKFISSR